MSLFTYTPLSLMSLLVTNFGYPPPPLPPVASFLNGPLDLRQKFQCKVIFPPRLFIKMATTDCFGFNTNLHGFHFYRNSVSGNIYIGQDTCLKCKLNNTYGKFAVYDKAILSGNITLSVVGHIPTKLSMHILFAIQGQTYLELWKILSHTIVSFLQKEFRNFNQ